MDKTIAKGKINISHDAKLQIMIVLQNITHLADQIVSRYLMTMSRGFVFD